LFFEKERCRAAATGCYFYRLQFGEQVLSRKFLLLR